MSLEKTKIVYMGEEISPADLPETDAVSLDDYFAQVTLSPHAIDMCSKCVPESVWKQQGVYTWLQGRANHVKKLPTSKKEISLGRLKYMFEYDASGPVLKTVILLWPKTLIPGGRVVALGASTRQTLPHRGATVPECATPIGASMQEKH